MLRKKSYNHCRALHDGCCLIEEIMKEYETWIKKNRRDASSYIYP